MSLISNNLGSSKRGPSLPPNPRPYQGRQAPLSRNTDHPGIYESASLPPFRGSTMQSGQFDDPRHPPALDTSSEYHHLFAAASGVLGMAPPPLPRASAYPPPDYSEPADQYNRSEPPLIPGQSNLQQEVPSQSISPYRSTTPLSSYAHSFISTEPPSVELERRPTSDRLGYSTTEDSRIRATKAVDLRAPPYTKEYIDDYRQRIKADPDPEAHFAYARYLIDAAKKIGADAKDQRAVRKYRDTLIQEPPFDEAQFFLANCYGTGMLGLQVDHEKAYHLYLQAAKQNHAAATYRVAVCNEIGAGTRRSPLVPPPSTERQHHWGTPRPSSRCRNPHALHELALLHEATGGQIVPHDPLQAKDYYSRAAYLGYTQSQHKLGQCYEFGTIGCPVDPRRSIAWYTKAAEKGNAEAELALSGWYLTGSEGVLKQSDSEAYLWARRAANKGLAKAEYAVGYYAEVGIGIKQDVEFAKRWYMRAAAQGNKRAMNRLTEMKRQGNKRANMARPTRQQAKDECVVC
ncbi:hypothetical protein B0F90DRAFT_1714152 [Multifurca ochricompacta]|uniref:HCP-like protein n=1 Tax=Multifurca ochricompacta TaxID=376703 RepID=A0AAD4M5Q9_9AGAM|nr:hypothetical protein B0F90DRAFT_1714152 [Multifurca ochricompacta]